MVETVLDNVSTLYQTLKQLCGEVRKDKRLPAPPADSVTVHSALCGSQLTLDARIEDGVIGEIGYKVRACSLGQAATAIVARRAPGMNAEALRRIGDQLRAILGGRLIRCDWPELEVFALARDMPSRHGSPLLPFEALELLLDRAAQLRVPADAVVGIPTNPSGRS